MRLGVLARNPPQQPAQIVPRVAARIVAVDEEVAPEAPAKLHEASRHLRQAGGVIFLMGVPVSKSKRTAPGLVLVDFLHAARSRAERAPFTKTRAEAQELSSQSRIKVR